MNFYRRIKRNESEVETIVDSVLYSKQLFYPSVYVNLTGTIGRAYSYCGGSGTDLEKFLSELGRNDFPSLAVKQYWEF